MTHRTSTVKVRYWCAKCDRAFTIFIGLDTEPQDVAVCPGCYSSCPQTGSLATAIPQSSPIGNGGVVIEHVIQSLEARAEFGMKKYGTLLRTHNGRDALVDAYQEALDQVMYLAQAIMEQSDERKALELWKRWFDNEACDGAPYHTWESDEYCFFCGWGKHLGHGSDCPYVAACKLLNKEVK